MTYPYKKTVLLFLCALVCFSNLYAQNKFKVNIENIGKDGITSKIEYNCSIIFDRINKGKTTFPPECISTSGANDILNILKYSNITIDTSKKVYNGILTSYGYQIRGVPVLVHEKGVTMRAVINFSPKGMVESFHFAIDENIYNSILEENTSEVDFKRRQTVLDFIENFRTAYNRKDINLISKIYSDDAFIITGYIHTIEVTDKKVREYGIKKEAIEYNIYSKGEYIKNLTEIFAKNRFVNLSFENISVLQHPTHKQIYGVTLLQAWRSQKYDDDGWLFIALEFINDNTMLIHIRTWQPYILNNLVLPREEIYQLGTFDF